MPRLFLTALLLGTLAAMSQLTTGQHISGNESSALSPEVNSFIPRHAQLIKKLSISFDRSDRVSIALAYATKVNDYGFAVGVLILDYQGSVWVVSYKETGDVGTRETQ